MADFNKAPYYDDFDENKKFLQILFQPGRPVQARELTQLQTILQNQVERGGAHIFKQGSKVFSSEVVGGQQSYDSTGINYIKINTNDYQGNIVDVSNFIGKTIRGHEMYSNNITGTGYVVSATANASGDPATLFVRWEGEISFVAGDVVLQTWDPTGAITSYYTANVMATDRFPVGRSSVYETTPGVYFVNGRYIKSDAQSLILGKYTSNVTYRVGFDIVESTVSSSDDSSLLDPASGFSNYTGSGADRYKIDLVLTKRGDGDIISQIESSNNIETVAGELFATNTFFEIARVIDGKLSIQARSSIYAEIEKSLARRSYDQTGNYTVIPPMFEIKEKATGGPSARLEGADKFLFGIEGGRSYVHGFEYDNSGGQITWIELDKPRTTTTSELQIPILYTNYITLHDTQNNTSEGIISSGKPAKGFFDVNQQPRVSLFSQDSFITDSELGANVASDLSLSANMYNSILVGTARAESFIYDKKASERSKELNFQGRSYRLYLRNFQANYVEGASNGVNQVDVSSVEHRAYSDNDPYGFSHITYYFINTVASGMTAGDMHGFANNGAIGTPTEFSSGADYVNISGFNVSGGYWNIDHGQVVFSNGICIGVQSTRQSSSNNADSTALPDASNNGIITRTTRNKISPRRLLLLDATTRALWSDAYNEATIEITAGPGIGDRRKVVDYIGGSTTNSIHNLQGAGDTGYISDTNLTGTGKRGLLLVDREFSAIPTRDTQYRIDFSLKNARSVGINANTFANGQSTTDLRYILNLESQYDQGGQFEGKVKGATPNFIALWDVDAVSGISPVGSLGEFNTAITGGIYAGQRAEGKTIMKGSTGAKLLGATGRQAVKTFKTVQGTHANTNFVAQRVLTNLPVASGIIEQGMVSHLFAYDGEFGSQRWYPYVDGGSKTLSLEEANQFVHVVDKTTGRVVDFNEGGSVVIATPDLVATNHKLTITLPTTGEYSTTNGDLYDVIATVIHKNVTPKIKTLITANAVGVAPDIAGGGTGGYNLSNGQMIISNAGGNNTLTEIPINKVPGGRDSLGIADVYTYKVLNTRTLGSPITDSMVKLLANGNTSLLNTLGGYDVTNRYRLDTGQKNHIYDHASLILKSGEEAANGRCLVLFDYFAHANSGVGTGDPGYEPKYFSVDSYQYTEDFTVGAGHNFAVNDILRSNNSGVMGRVFGVTGNDIKLVDIVPYKTNAHFVLSDDLVDMNASTTKSSTITSAVVPLQLSYENIPPYHGTRYSLRDVLDFRPRRADADLRANPIAENVAIPIDCTAVDIRQYPDVIPKFKVASYNGRVDKIVLNKNRNIYARKGVESITPRPSDNDPDGMVLANVIYPPYAFNKKHVMINAVENRRYTMKDISKIDKRVRNLEYYVALNSLERLAKDQVVLDSQGLDRFKNGILTDNFNSFNTIRPLLGETIHDTPYGHREYTYAMNRSRGHLRPSLAANTIYSPFVFNKTDSGQVTTSGLSDEVITLDYTEVTWDDGPKQSHATQSKEYDENDVLNINGEGDGRVNINPFSRHSYSGTMHLNPNFDNFVDLLDAGEVQFTNLTGASDALAFGDTPGQPGVINLNAGTSQTNHGSWEDQFGTSEDPAVITSEEFEISGASLSSGKGRSGGDVQDAYHATMIEPQAFTLEVADTFVRTFATIMNVPQSVITRHENSTRRAEVAQFMRNRDVAITATGLKPYTSMHGHFGGIGVDSYISSCDMVRFDTDCQLGKRIGQSGFVQERIFISGQETSSAKLVAVRGNTAFITDIRHGSISPTNKFYTPSIILVGNNTEQTAVTSAAMISDGIPQDINNSYDHRSGYVMAVTTPERIGSGEWIKLSPEAQTVSNSISLPNNLDGDGLSEDSSGLPSCVINIVKGKSAGKHGIIDAYEASTREAHVDWTGERDERIVNDIGEGVDANGVPNDDLQDYYTLGIPESFGTSTIHTSFIGEFFGAFHVPSNATTKFKTGTKKLMINDRGDNSPFLIRTWASAPYFSTGQIDHLIDDVVATRDTMSVLTDTGFHFGYSTNETTGGVALTAIRQSDQVRGILHLVVDVDIVRQGGAAGHSDYAYIPYRPHNWIVQSQPGHPGHKWAMGQVRGGTLRDDGTYDNNPVPILNADGNPNLTGWTEWKNSQGDPAHFRNTWGRQIHSHSNYIDYAKYKVSGCHQSAYLFYNQRMKFPGLVPVGGNIGGCSAFATVTNGRITDVTVTDAGAFVATEGGVQPRGPVWRALYLFNGWSESSPGSPVNAWSFVGSSVVSSDPAVIRDKVPYIDKLLTDAENGTGLTSGLINIDDDPLAQSFTVEGAPRGVFITGVDLWFQSKPIGTQQQPVTLELRRMVNGYPDSSGPIPCVAGSHDASVTVNPANINVRSGDSIANGGSGLPDFADEGSYTTFSFPAPVYLQPQTDYCFAVICSGSREYNLWSSDLRGDVLGTRTPVDVAKAGNHYQGSLFMSQNAKTWEPDQYKDLMFRFRRAKFNVTDGHAIIAAGAEADRRPLDVYSMPVPGTVRRDITIDHDFDFFRFNGESIIPKSINGLPSAKLTYSYDAYDTSTGTTTGDQEFTPKTTTYLPNPLRLEKDKKHDSGSFRVRIDMQSIDRDDKVSPVFDISTAGLVALKNYINDGGIRNDNIKYVGPEGTNYAAGDLFSLDVLKTNSSGFQVSTMSNNDIGFIRVKEVSGGAVDKLEVYPVGAETAGKNYTETPTAIKHSKATDSGTDVVESHITLEGETGAIGGNSKFRYVTKPVKLKSEASDISVAMDIHRPLGSSVYVYYKVKHKDDPENFDDKKWIKMSQVSPINDLHSISLSAWTSVDDTPMVEHTFSTGSTNEVIKYSDTTGTNYDGFKYFAIKIVGFTDNKAQVPVIGTLRAIAVT